MKIFYFMKILILLIKTFAKIIFAIFSLNIFSKLKILLILYFLLGILIKTHFSGNTKYQLNKTYKRNK